MQARRRAWPAETWSSVSSRAVLRCPRRVSRSRWTTTVAAVLACRWSVGEPLEEGGEGLAAAGRPVGPVICGRVAACSCTGSVVASRCGHRFEDLAQERELKSRDGEVSGHGGVVVDVERERRLRVGGVFLGGHLLVLGRVDDLLVGLDRGERASGGPSELRGVEPGGHRDQVGLDPGTLLGGDAGRELGQGVGDHARVLGRERTLGHRVTGGGGGAEVVGQPGLTGGRRPGLAGLAGQPGRPCRGTRPVERPRRSRHGRRVAASGRRSDVRSAPGHRPDQRTRMVRGRRRRRRTSGPGSR